jgi:hypothetical protein
VRLADLGVELMLKTEFGEFIDEQTDSWAGKSMSSNWNNIS